MSLRWHVFFLLDVDRCLDGMCKCEELADSWPRIRECDEGGWKLPSYQRLLAFGFVVLLVVGILQLPLVELPPAEGKPAANDGRPRLVVMVVFDQLRGDYPKKWQSLFVDGGFRRLQSEGAWFTDCHYPYCYTLTAPGHASLATGTYPAKHGIIANDWFDREAAKSVTSVTAPLDRPRGGRGPYRRTAMTVGDVLLDFLKGRSRVVSLSIKDRAAILMAAIHAQICYWFNGKTGDFETSPYYRDTPHSWVKSFNKERLADRWLGHEWNRLRPGLDYVAYSGPDDFFAEGTGHNQGRVFPHPFKLGEGEKAKEKYYSAMETAPAGNDLLLRFAKTAIVAEKLGQTEKTDLLCLSFSSNDLVGHCWGPDSQEVLDITLRSDLLIKDLLDFLDAKVGKGNYVFAVSADHGVCPLPEFAVLQGKDAGRVEPNILSSLAENFLNERFKPAGGKMSWFESPDKNNPWIYLNRRGIASLSLQPSDVERALADWLKEQPGIEAAFTRTEVMDSNAKNSSPHFEAVRKSFRPESSGDVMVLLKPYHLFSPPLLSKDPTKDPAYRTTHGTPHPYDTHVPLLVMGPRIVPGTYQERIAPQAMAAILSECLRIPPPNGSEFPVPAGVMER